ncbi:MAG TPA: hypothetical protein VGQ08_02830 [Nitrospiraceae bacterium]|nr:hypothetical protein [Nitrospiraceae bacterium]
MRMLSDLLKKLRPLEVDDEFFGCLIYMKMPKGRISYWEAKRTFSSSGREIELFIDAPALELPPSELQRQFFLTVERHYSSILAAVETVLRPQFEEWSRKPLSGAFSTEFTMTSFSIPNVVIEDSRWQMYFESQTDANHLFNVALRGEHPTGVSIDG